MCTPLPGEGAEDGEGVVVLRGGVGVEEGEEVGEEGVKRKWEGVRVLSGEEPLGGGEVEDERQMGRFVHLHAERPSQQWPLDTNTHFGADCATFRASHAD